LTDCLLRSLSWREPMYAVGELQSVENRQTKLERQLQQNGIAHGVSPETKLPKSRNK
jgi:hypothetical protein